MKSQGSCKSGKNWLASITVTESTADTPGPSIEVTFQKHHYGYDRDVNHLMMTPAERAEIAEELAKGVPISTLMDRIGDGASGKSDALTPLQVMQRGQLRNIRREFNFLLKSGAIVMMQQA